MTFIDIQWVLFHGSARMALQAQGYITIRVETRHGEQWAQMGKEAR